MGRCPTALSVTDVMMSLLMRHATHQGVLAGLSRMGALLSLSAQCSACELGVLSQYCNAILDSHGHDGGSHDNVRAMTPSTQYI